MIFSNPAGFPDNMSNLWVHGGYLPNGVWGLIMACVVVMFSFGGIELLGITAGEAEDPDKSIPQAKEKGAVAIVTQRKLQPEEAEGLTVLQVPDLKKALQAVVPFFHDYPARSMRVIGITGTNGKTSISYMVRAMLRRMGCRVGLIGTIQIMIEDQAPRSGSLTGLVILDSHWNSLRLWSLVRSRN